MTDILGIDPGKRTGIALVNYTAVDVPVLMDSWDVPGGAMGFLAWVNENDWVHMRNMFIVYERFIPREGVHGVGVDASEVTGTMLAWAQDQGYPTVPQPAAGRMKAVPDKVLSKFHKFTGKAERNEKEAFRHVIWYLKNAKHMPTITKGWLDE